jgi:tripartite-type tricarboxylate transporter receptor subunit TctC
MTTRRNALLAVGALAVPFVARSQNLRPLRIIIPFPAGGISDAMARILATRLSAELGRSVLVDPQPGGSGLIAARRTLNVPADGTTLLIISPTMLIILPKTMKLEFDPIEEFVPVTNIGSNPLVLGVHKSVPANNLREFIQYAQTQPASALTFASGGAGTSTHLVAELFFKRAGLKLVHVPYKGGAPAVQDLLAGHVQAYFGNPAELITHKDSGNIRLLASSGETRMAELPEVQTLGEVLSGLSLVTWNGLGFRKGTPVADIERVSQAIQRISKEPEYIQSMNKIGVTPVGNTPEQFGAAIRRDRLLWNEAIDSAGIKQS